MSLDDLPGDAQAWAGAAGARNDFLTVESFCLFDHKG
jgi:hypothetical protein